MVPPILKELFVPGTILFFLFAATIGTLLLFRKANNGRAGRRCLVALVTFYWIGSTPIAAIALVRALSPAYNPVESREQARHATAIVVLGGGVHAYRSRGAMVLQGNREHSLRALEAARVYRILDHPWVIVTGSLEPERKTEAAEMARSLIALGVAADRIVEEGKSRNTHDHTLYVPPLLQQRGVKQFVMVTSRQHMARSLRAFRNAGLDPVPSSPDFFVPDDGRLSLFIPSEAALEATSAMMHDLGAIVYYRLRGWN